MTFGGIQGKELESQLNIKTFEIGSTNSTSQTVEKEISLKSKQDADRIKNLIANAKTLEEIQRLEIQLQTGKLPQEDIVEMDE